MRKSGKQRTYKEAFLREHAKGNGWAGPRRFARGDNVEVGNLERLRQRDEAEKLASQVSLPQLFLPCQ